MNSIFLLSEDNSTIDEAHFNLWMVNEDEPFVDIGLKLKKGQKLILYLPWGDAEINDLYETIKDRDVLNAIFNQHLKISTSDDDSYLTVSRNNEKFDLVRACLHKKNIEIENTTHHNKFTKFTIEANPQATNIDLAYVRLRATGFKDDVFNKKHEEKGRGISPYHETIEAVDFRINELRTVKQSNFERGININTTPKINILHFFLLKSFREINSLNSPNYDRCRELEDKAWDKYLSLKNDNREAKLAYHWKKNGIEEGQHFSILTTFNKKKISKKTISLYLIALILLNLLSTYIYQTISSNVCTVT